MADGEQTPLTPPQPLITPESFLQESIAPRFKRRIDDLRRRIVALEEEVGNMALAMQFGVAMM